MKGLSFVSVRARPLVLKGELVRMSDWAHEMSSWARLCNFVGAIPLVSKGELVSVSD